MTLILAHVAKSFKKRGLRVDVLTDLNASFEPGRSVGILGAPGSGKSTLMKILSGAMRPSAGRIHRGSRASFIVGAGMTIDRKLPVREVIAFFARLYGARSRTIIDFVADFGELGPVLDQRLERLSKDRRSRLSFTLSYALPFDIYLADEALVGGSQDFQDRCSALINERRKTSGLIFTTSKIRKVEAFADVGALLHRGELTVFPTVEEAIKVYEALNPMWQIYGLLPDPSDESDDEEEESGNTMGLF